MKLKKCIEEELENKGEKCQKRKISIFKAGHMIFMKKLLTSQKQILQFYVGM